MSIEGIDVREETRKRVDVRAGGMLWKVRWGSQGMKVEHNVVMCMRE